MVSKNGVYDTSVLLDDGSSLLPRDLKSKVPESVNDLNEASKALAFELYTACGFHLFRVVEAVVRRYWDAVAGEIPRPDPQTIGVLASQLEDKKLGDAKIREALKQLTKLHRNPIAHPETILSLEEAIGIVGMARSVISPMLERLIEQVDASPSSELITPPQ